MPTPMPTPEPYCEFYADRETITYGDDVWDYKSPELGIHIEKVYYEYMESWAYVAEIHTKDPDRFLNTGFAYHKAGGPATRRIYEIAAEYKAVFALNIDYYTDPNNTKAGIIIRNGEVYRKSLLDNMMAVYPGGELKVYRKGDDITPDDLLAAGVTTTFSFGPILLEGGQLTPELTKHWLKQKNPRSGLGMVEPGFYYAVIVDGRQPNVSRGATLTEYAQLFSDLGCTVAYNFDGGQSTGMVFMGEILNTHSKDYNGTHWAIHRRQPDILYIGTSQWAPIDEDQFLSYLDTVHPYDFK